MRELRLSWHEFLALYLCAALATCGLAWLVWEVRAHALSFNGYFANGAFQLLNPLRRIADGQVYGRDFINFHGIGTVWLHLPFYLLAGSDLRASEISRFLVSGLCHAVVSVALTLSFGSIFETRRQAVAFGLIFFAAGALLFLNIYLPGNSTLGARSFFPLLLAAAVAARRSLLWIGLALAASLITSVEHGIATLLALLVAIASTFVFARLTDQRLPLIGGALLGLFLFFVVLFVATAGHVSAVLRYALIDIPADQFWYFGGPPNRFLPQDAARLMTDRGFPRFAATYVLGCLAAGYVVARVRALTPAAWFLLAYATASLVSQLGYIASINLQPGERAAFALVLAITLSIVGRRFYPIPAVVLILYMAVWGIRNFVIFPPSPVTREDAYLSPSWRAHLFAIEQHSQGGAIWSVYSGLPETLRGSFHPSFDYIIHALGPDHRKRYIDTFLADLPRVVRLDPTWRWPYGGWLLMQNWPFYREVFRRYEPVYSDQWGSLWLPAETTAASSPSSVPLNADEQGCYEITQSEPSVLSVEVLYEVRNPWAWVPVLGKTPRFFLDVSGEVNPALRIVSLPDPRTYGGTFAFPVFVKAREAARVCPTVASLLGGVSLEIKRLSFVREELTAGATRYLIDRN